MFLLISSRPGQESERTRDRGQAIALAEGCTKGNPRTSQMAALKSAEQPWWSQAPEIPR